VLPEKPGELVGTGVERRPRDRFLARARASENESRRSGMQGGKIGDTPAE
jgi:hypothetical protein